MPGQAYPMYVDEIWGRTGSHQIRVEPEELVNRPLLAGDFDHSCLVTAFDAHQVAGAWLRADPSRNMAGDSAVDLYDVAAVAAAPECQLCCRPYYARRGQRRGRALHWSPSKAEIRVGEEMAVAVAANRPTAGVAATSSRRPGRLWHKRCDFDPFLLQVKEVRWNAKLDKALHLGPVVDNRTGTSILAPIWVVTMRLRALEFATVIFVGGGVGETTIGLEQIQAVDGSGRRIGAQARALGGAIHVDGNTIFAPKVGR